MEYKVSYKAYNRGLINQFGEKFEIGKKYTVENELKWQRNGFHFSSNLEDVFRFYPNNEELDICQVLGSGEIQTREDTFYDYETHYSSEITITKILSREEVIEYAKNLDDYRFCRFVSGFKLTEEEINYLMEGRGTLVQRYVDYYQYGDENAFKR